jgi:glutathione S-transferase
VKLYGCPNSRSLRAAWALEEAGAAYEYVLVDLFKGAGRAPQFLALNPAGKIPVLTDGALTLTESAAIVAHIGDKFPASGQMPRDAAARADCLRWMFFATTELEQPLWTIAKHRFALPKDKRVAGVENTARWEFENTARILEAVLGQREFICGSTLTGADILLAHTLAWARSAKVMPESATLNAYRDRLYARPALARARAREAAGSSAA